ncbi:DNA-binding transcriptional repressor AcrR [Oxobacter pfennigii]|uniref:DNA-binding transcriptional repressor AcrR n=1 Tax=Oxobacter pfennigii TaxID=36849 RepID=A0A0P8YG49_9CLOT|nr:TetR/AcrR family transcriptional regulator [Oxobacter pfennigii]KPU46013.1 DNA-binding transcriptional repressor AcrR [Oxobacter pfennigii]
MATYRTGIETKFKIENAAKKLFYSKGVESTTYAQIAKKANVDISSIVYHFKSFDNLMLEIKNHLSKDRKLLIKEKINIQYPNNNFAEMILNGVEYRKKMELYAAYPKYYRFYRDVYYKVQHKSAESLIMNMYDKELSLNLDLKQKILYESIITPFQFTVPDFFFSEKVQLNPHEVCDFHVRYILKTLGQTEDFINKHIQTTTEISSNIEITCDNSMNLS